MNPTTLVAFVVAISFAAGLNMYATLACLGIVARAGWLTLPHELGLLVSLWVIVPALVMFLIEIFADHVPLLDFVWKVGHAFLRPPVAALVSYQATAHLSHGLQIGVAIASAAIAAAANGTKSLTRVAAVAEDGIPLPSVATNSAGDLLALAITLAASRHPLLTGFLVVCSLSGILFLVRRIWRAIKRDITVAKERYRIWRSRYSRSDT